MRTVCGSADTLGFAAAAVSTTVSALSSSPSSTAASVTCPERSPAAMVRVVAERVKSAVSVAVLAPPAPSVTTVPPAGAGLTSRRVTAVLCPSPTVAADPMARPGVREVSAICNRNEYSNESVGTWYGAPGGATNPSLMDSAPSVLRSATRLTVMVPAVRPAASDSVRGEIV